MMFGFSEYSEEGRPWFRIGRVSVTSTVLLVGVLTLSMVLVAVLKGAGAERWVSALPLVTPAVWQGQVWRLVTWPLVNIPSIWFVLSMLMLYWFGREVERVLGRVGLLRFAGWVAAALVVVTLVMPGGVLGGSDLLGFGIFLAFAIMHPGVPTILFGLTMKWVALILIGIQALQCVAFRNWSGLVQLATLCAASAVVLQAMGAASALPWLRIPVVRIKRRSASARPATGDRGDRGERPVRRSGAGPREFVSPEPEVDRLLDKVAASGLHSLTEAERRVLAEASERYQRRK